jgi:hypothetical protein
MNMKNSSRRLPRAFAQTPERGSYVRQQSFIFNPF